MDEAGRPETDDVSGDLNLVTQHVPARWLNHAPWSFEQIFKCHFEDLHALRQGSKQPGYLAVVVCGNRQLLLSRTFAPGAPGSSESVVVGRHLQTDICLADDPCVALRHLLIRVTLDSTERPSLRLLDLKTGQGFIVDGVGPCSSLAGDGNLCVHLGPYALLMFPVRRSDDSWPQDADQAWAARPKVRVFDKRAHPSQEDDWRPVAPLVDGDTAENISSITLLPEAADVSAPGATDGRDVAASLTASHGDKEVIYPLTAAQLSRGVLLGRYRRCHVRSQRGWRSEIISRVHLLIIGEDDRFFAIDVASTNGTHVDGEVIRVAELTEAVTVELGAGNRLRWNRIQNAAEGQGEIAIDWRLN